MPRTRKQSYKQKQLARRRKFQHETPEKRALRLEKNKIRAAVRRASENEFQREMRLAKERARRNTERASQRAAEKCINNRKKLKSTKKTVSPGLIAKQNRAYERLKAQREAAAKRQAERRRQETPEQRAIRLEKDRIRVALSRANESAEARANRLARQRYQINATRLRLRYNAQLLSQQGDTIIGPQNKPIIDPLQKMIEKKLNNLTKGSFAEQARAIAEFHGMYQQLKAYTSLSNYPEVISENDEEDDDKSDLEDYSESEISLMNVGGVDCEIIIEEGTELKGIKLDEKTDCSEESNIMTASCTSLTEEEYQDNKEADKLNPVQEIVFESVLCEPVGIKQEVSDTHSKVETQSVETSDLIIPESPHERSSVHYSSRSGIANGELAPSTFEFCPVNHPGPAYLIEGLKMENEEQNEENCNS